MPVKETVLKGERVDEADFARLRQQHGVAVLSEISVMPFVHAMPAQALCKNAAFQKLLEDVLIEGFERFKARGEAGDEDVIRMIALLEQAAPDWTVLNFEGINEDIRRKVLIDIGAPPDHDVMRALGDPLRVDQYGCCPRITPTVPLLTWSLNVTNLSNKIRAACTTLDEAPLSETHSAALRAEIDEFFRVLVRHIDEQDMLHSSSFLRLRSINIHNGAFAVDVKKSTLDSALHEAGQSVHTVYEPKRRLPGDKRTHTHTHTHIHMHTCTHAHMHTCMHAHTLHAQAHTHTHTHKVSPIVRASSLWSPRTSRSGAA